MMLVSKTNIEPRVPVIEIGPMTPRDVGLLASQIRHADKEELLALGLTPQMGVWKSYRGSFMPQAAFVDGKIAAVWGVVGTPGCEMGCPWLLTTDEVYKLSALKFSRIYQLEVQKMLKVFPHLVNYVDSCYDSSIRMLHIIGFTVENPEPYGPKNHLFCKFWKKSTC